MMLTEIVEQEVYPINPYDHTGLTQEQIKALKHLIDTDETFPYKYFVTMTWDPSSQYEYADRLAEYEVKRKDDWRRYLQKIAWKTGSHIKSFGAISLPHMNIHVHSIVCSEKPITASTAKKLWRHGQPVGKHWGPYNPRWAEDNGHQDLTRGALKYIHAKHHEHERIYFGDVFCPAKKTSCRKGRCAFRTQQYKRGETTTTKSK